MGIINSYDFGLNFLKKSKIFKRHFLFIVLFSLISVSATAATVSSVNFTGQKRVPDSTLRTTVTTRGGLLLNDEIISEDIHKLYDLGQFDNIEVMKKVSKSGVGITFVLREKPFITEVKFDGNKKIKKKDLREKVVVRTYRPLNGLEISESMQRIRDAYAEKGYYLTEVNYHIEPKSADEDVLVFDIKENAEAVIREVRFRGNTVFSEAKLRKIVRTRRKDLLSFLTKSGKYSEEMLSNDVLRLTFTYLNDGYLRVKVLPPKITISSDKRYIFVLFSIFEGEQYTVDNVDVAGDVLTTRAELLSMVKMKKGSVFSQQVVEGDILKLTEMYGNQSYAYANVYPDVIPNDVDLTADIIFRIYKGSKIKIERINITGNTKTRDKVIRRELLIMEDDMYSEEFIRKSKLKLQQLGFFEEINFATPRASSDDTVDLNIEVKEKNTGSFNVGVAFSSFEHFLFQGSVQQANFFGYGVSGQVGTQLSSKRQFFYISAKDPYFLDSNWMLGGSLYRTSFNYQDFRRKALGGDISLGRRFLEKYSATLGYRAELVSVDSFSRIVPQLFRSHASGFTSALSLDLDRDTRDNRLYPKKGMYTVGSVEVSGAKLGGSNDFLKLKYKAMYYQPIWKKRIIFKTYGRIGYIKNLGNDLLPLYDRFFMGGVFDLRGYYPNSVGPRLRIPTSSGGGDEEFIYGGNKEMLMIGELEVVLFNKFGGVSLVAFFDAGNTYAEDQNYSFKNLRKDYGFGVRWNSPMGPLRFEWGLPLDRRKGDPPVQFNFTVGSLF